MTGAHIGLIGLAVDGDELRQQLKIGAHEVRAFADGLRAAAAELNLPESADG